MELADHEEKGVSLSRTTACVLRPAYTVD